MSAEFDENGLQILLNSMRSLLLSEKNSCQKVYVRIRVNFHIAIVKVKHRDLSREAARLILYLRPLQVNL